VTSKQKPHIYARNGLPMYNRALKLIRQYHRLSQVELADHLGLSKSFISEIEKKNGKKPSIDVLERYAAHFNISLSSLFFFAESTEASDIAERSRVFAADKVLKMLEWLEETTSPNEKADSW
jgi:transcriptional regulator with XRE-family HTH domain